MRPNKISGHQGWHRLHSGEARMYPFVLVAAGLALTFLIVTTQRPRPAPLLALILWSAYAVYEYYVANGTLCDRDCNIRVDLVLFLPLLGFATYFGLQTEPSSVAVAIMYTLCFGTVALLASLFGQTLIAVAGGAGALVALALGVRSLVQRRQA
jgi:lysylphosphatidylglycerol synthetase-like protein (DUF2156 family)